MLERITPPSFTDSIFYRESRQIKSVKKVWSGTDPFQEDIYRIELPAPGHAFHLFYEKWEEEKAFRAKAAADPFILRLWIARYVQLYHWIDEKYVEGAGQGVEVFNRHPASPVNASDRFAFILSQPDHFTRILEMAKMIQESKPRIRRYLKNNRPGK